MTWLVASYGVFATDSTSSHALFSVDVRKFSDFAMLYTCYTDAVRVFSVRKELNSQQASTAHQVIPRLIIIVI